MERETQNFIDILSEKIVLYEKLLEVFAEEKEAIMKNSLPRILEKLREKEALVGNLEINEKKRKEIIAYYSAKFDVPKQSLTLSKLSGLFQGPVSGKLLDLRNRLKERMDAVAEAGQGNKKLIAACSSSLDGSRYFFERLMGQGQEYSASGKARSALSVQGRVFNSKA